MPDGFHLEQPAVAAPDVVLPEFERRSPAGALEIPPVGLLEHRSVLTLATEPLTP